MKSGKNFIVILLLEEKPEIHLTLEQKKHTAKDDNIRDRTTEGLGSIAMVGRTKPVHQVREQGLFCYERHYLQFLGQRN